MVCKHSHAARAFCNCSLTPRCINLGSLVTNQASVLPGACSPSCESEDAAPGLQEADRRGLRSPGLTQACLEHQARHPHRL